GSSSLPRARPFPSDTIIIRAQQRHSSRVCVARSRARTLRSFAAPSRNHRSAVGHTRRSAPQPSLGSSRRLPYDLRAILKQALTRALAERGQQPRLLAQLRRPCAGPWTATVLEGFFAPRERSAGSCLPLAATQSRKRCRLPR